jgi:histidinol-phosphate aminotransferase
MKITRRGFVGTIGLGAATSLLSGTSLINKGASAQTVADAASGIHDGGIMQLNQNESARGPGAKTMQAIHNHTTKRVGRGYSPDHVNELRSAIADEYSVERENVMLATGSSPILRGAVHAFCSAEKGLVTAGPTYATCEQTARQIGAGLEVITLDDSMSIDLEGMANAAVGAGLVYFCNPNNPTGTVHGPGAVESFVRRIMRESPDTKILIDEAYINYAAEGTIETALPLVHEFENVFISRSFSKAHALAGMRIGYALGQEQTLRAMTSAWGMGEVNMLGAVAALTALQDKEHLEWERQENAEIRAFVSNSFREMGYEVTESATNHIFVNLRQPARDFRAACLEHKILVGRDFPPFENTHCRISMGSREEMTIAVEVFKKVLA